MFAFIPFIIFLTALAGSLLIARFIFRAHLQSEVLLVCSLSALTLTIGSTVFIPLQMENLSLEAAGAPLLFSILLLLGLGILFLKDLVSFRENSPSSFSAPYRLMLTILALALYLLSLSYFSYFVPTFCFILLAAFILSEKRIFHLCGLAGFWLIFSYFTFEKLLQIPLPG